MRRTRPGADLVRCFRTRGSQPARQPARQPDAHSGGDVRLRLRPITEGEAKQPRSRGPCRLWDVCRQQGAPRRGVRDDQAGAAAGTQLFS